MDFKTAQSWFKSDRIKDLSQSPRGLRFLKLRSLGRRQYLEALFASVGVTPKSTLLKDLPKEAFETESITEVVIDSTIRHFYTLERQRRQTEELELVDQLYQLDLYDWGGLHQNSLEKTIVNNYVKRIRNYEQLSASIENELHHSMRGYVLCSWYNHWTSIIIEDIFRDHPAVLPAVGLIKRIDFFIRDIPFDLKVTFFPEGYIKDCRGLSNEGSELTLLKQWARQFNIKFSPKLSESLLLSDLWKKASDHPSVTSQNLIRELSHFRRQLIEQTQINPEDLITWLYENQGVRRFDASNRLFLILIDLDDFFASWKLKRAHPLLNSGIGAFLDKISASPGRELNFNWDGERYTVVSDAIIITKPQR